MNVKKYHGALGESADDPETLLEWASCSTQLAKKLSK